MLRECELWCYRSSKSDKASGGQRLLFSVLNVLILFTDRLSLDGALCRCRCVQIEWTVCHVYVAKCLDKYVPYTSQTTNVILIIAKHELMRMQPQLKTLFWDLITLYTATHTILHEQKCWNTTVNHWIQLIHFIQSYFQSQVYKIKHIAMQSVFKNISERVSFNVFLH